MLISTGRGADKDIGARSCNGMASGCRDCRDVTGHLTTGASVLFPASPAEEVVLVAALQRGLYQCSGGDALQPR